MNKRQVAVAVSIVLAVTALLYLGGVLGQLHTNYESWLTKDGILGQVQMEPVDWNPVVCFPAAFSLNGLKGILLIVVMVGGVVVYFKLQNRFGGKEFDPRGFKTSSTGAYGTAGWMGDKEMQSILEISSIDKAKGTVLGEHRGKAVCMPEDTRLNRHIAVFGASGTMKSRAVIRNALFQSIKRGESVVITDPKAELYNDTSELYRKHGYEVKVFNLVDPAHGDSWNCMADLHGDTLMAQVLQNQSVRNIITRSDINLTAPGQRKCAYYIILSDQDATMAFLSSLFFSFLFIRLTRFADSQPGGKCTVPVNLILDEFNNVGRIGGAADGSDFARSLSVIRSRDIRVMLAVQSLGQLQNRYPNNLWSEIIGNCDIQLMLGCTDDMTAQYFSSRSGDMSIRVDSTSTTRQTMAVAQFIPQYRQTEGQGRRKLLTPDEVLRLPNEELLCIIRGCNVLKLKKLDYTKHPMADELARTSIMDYRPAQQPVPKQVPAPAPPDRDEQKPARKAKSSLYSSAKPPTDF